MPPHWKRWQKVLLVVVLLGLAAAQLLLTEPAEMPDRPRPPPGAPER